MKYRRRRRFASIDQLAKQRGRVCRAVFDVGRQTEMIGARGQDATPAVSPDEEELDDHFLARVVRWKLLPEAESTHVKKLFTVKEHICPADPRRFVLERSPIGNEPALEMKWIRRVIDDMPVPRD